MVRWMVEIMQVLKKIVLYKHLVVSMGINSSYAMIFSCFLKQNFGTLSGFFDLVWPELLYGEFKSQVKVDVAEQLSLPFYLHDRSFYC